MEREGYESKRERKGGCLGRKEVTSIFHIKAAFREQLAGLQIGE